MNSTQETLSTLEFTTGMEQMEKKCSVKEASNFVREEIRASLVQDSKTIRKFSEANEVEAYFKKLFNKIQLKMKKRSAEFDESGTCVISALQIENKCYAINLGDSRAVIGSLKDSRKISCQISIDHKPNREDEKRRIENGEGEVSKERQAGSGPYRVYFKGKDGPGLAVSRTLGDLEGHKCGIVAEPEVSSKEIFPSDKFIVIASDGVWDVLNSVEVVGYVFSKLENGVKRAKLMEELVNETKSRWDILGMYREKLFKERGGEVSNKGINFRFHDDITAVVLFFQDEEQEE